LTFAAPLVLSGDNSAPRLACRSSLRNGGFSHQLTATTLGYFVCPLSIGPPGRLGRVEAIRRSCRPGRPYQEFTQRWAWALL